MKETRFDPAGDLLIVHARLWGPRGGKQARLRLAIDTGATHTLVLPGIIDELGYSPRDADAITTVRAALGKEQGYLLRVSRFEALGFALPDFPLHVFDMADGVDHHRGVAGIATDALVLVVGARIGERQIVADGVAQADVHQRPFAESQPIGKGSKKLLRVPSR